MIFKNEVSNQEELLHLNDQINDTIITSDTSLWLNHPPGGYNCVIINEKFVATEPKGGEHWEILFQWINKNLHINCEDVLYDEELEGYNEQKLWNYIDSYTRCAIETNMAFIEQYSCNLTYSPNKTPNFNTLAKILKDTLNVKKVYLDQSGYFQHLIRKAEKSR